MFMLSITQSTGYDAVVIESKLEGDQLVTDLTAIEHQIHTLTADNILCVMSTTSCFAPRSVDK